MTKKKVLLISGLGMIVGGIFLNVDKFGICNDMYVSDGYVGCFNTAQDSIGGIIELISLPLFIMTLLLFFVHDEVFNLWFKFARIWLPLGAAIVFFASSTNGGMLGSDQDWAAWFFSVTFLWVSVILIVYKLIRIYYYKKSR
jgi:hypothetical protein